MAAARLGLRLLISPSATCRLPRKRIDLLLVERGLFESRARARAAIEAGLVLANDKPVLKASETISADAVLQAQPAHPFVSRGGVKLAGALEQYPDSDRGSRLSRRRRLDRRLHGSLARQRRQRGFCDRRRARTIAPFPARPSQDRFHGSNRHPRRWKASGCPRGPTSWSSTSASFRSRRCCRLHLSLAAAPMHLLALIKPQFEAARKHSKRGIIRDAAVHQEVCDEIAAFAASLGCTDIRVFPLPDHQAETATSNSSSARAVVERLLIDHVGHLGDGVALVEGRSIFVPYTLGGETVEVAAAPGHHPGPAAIGADRTGKPGAHRTVLSAFRHLRRLRHPALGDRALPRLETRSRHRHARAGENRLRGLSPDRCPWQRPPPHDLACAQRHA